MMKLIEENEIDKVDALYQNAISYIEKEEINYCTWVRDAYPIRQMVVDGFLRQDMFVCYEGSKVAGSIVLNKIPHPSYENAFWQIPVNRENTLIVHTLLVEPEFYRQGIAKKMLSFAEEFAKQNNCSVIRLDTANINIPAKKLYESIGYTQAGLIDLKLDFTDEFFMCYEKEVV